MKVKYLQMAAVALAVAMASSSALAQKKYDPGATDKEIKVGHVIAYSGPASAYGAIGKAIGAYFDKINAEGGINGRSVKFLSLDDGYNPAKTVEQTRKLVEEDEVLLMFQPLGTPSNSAIPWCRGNFSGPPTWSRPWPRTVAAPSWCSCTCG